jgi:hypothetical protein
MRSSAPRAAGPGKAAVALLPIHADNLPRARQAPKQGLADELVFLLLGRLVKLRDDGWAEFENEPIHQSRFDAPGIRQHAA